MITKLLFSTFLIFGFYKNHSQDILILPLDSAEKMAAVTSEERTGLSLVSILGKDFNDQPAEKKTKLLNVMSSKVKQSFSDVGFQETTTYFSLDTTYKKTSGHLFFNGNYYGWLGYRAEGIKGFKSFYRQFFNNPNNRSFRNEKYFASSNFCDEYFENNHTYQVDEYIPDNSAYFENTLYELSTFGAVLVIAYDKQSEDFQSITQYYKSMISELQNSGFLVSLVIIDKRSFPRSINSLKKMKGDDSDSKRSTFYGQIWSDNELIFEFFDHNEKQPNGLKELLKKLTKPFPDEVINQYLESKKSPLNRSKLLDATEKDNNEEVTLDEHRNFAKDFILFSKMKADMAKSKAEFIRYLQSNLIYYNDIMDYKTHF